MFDHENAIQAINFFARKSPDKTISKEKAFALLYLADRMHLRRYGRSITGDEYEATLKAPVPVNTNKLIEKINKEN